MQDIPLENWIQLLKVSLSESFGTILVTGSYDFTGLSQLASLGYQMTVVDTQENIATAQAELHSVPNIQFVAGDVEQLPFADDSFEAVIACHLIQSCKWDRWVLQEIRRVLKPKGLLLVSVPAKKQLLGRLLQRFFNKIKRVFKRFLSSPTTATETNIKQPLQRRYKPSELQAILNDLAYDILSAELQASLPQQDSKKKNCSYVVLCQKTEESSSIPERSVFKNPSQFIYQFESDYKLALAEREQWHKQYASYINTEIRCFEEMVDTNGPILVITPHPDDELIGCGGTLIKRIRLGQPVTVLILTDGSNTIALSDQPDEIRKTVRLEEAQKIVAQMGAQLVLWQEPDSQLTDSADLILRMANQLDSLRPTTIFVPFINDPHPDHIAANKLLAKGLTQSSLNLSQVVILGYEIWSLAPPNVLSEIDTEFDLKTRLLLDYRTPMKVKDYVAYCRQLNIYHALKSQDRKGYTEGFFALDASAYTSLIGQITTATTY